ncbi:MAG: VOC family protein, partial [Candidatus Saccharimonadales bacterium]
VSDINQAIEDLKSKGISMLMYDDLGLPAQQDDLGVLRGKAAGMGGDIAWFADPAGNVLAVIEE